jgi:hypothetical protein
MGRISCCASKAYGPTVALRAHGRVVSAKHGSTALDGEVAILAHGRVVRALAGLLSATSRELQPASHGRVVDAWLQSARTGEW